MQEERQSLKEEMAKAYQLSQEKKSRTSHRLFCNNSAAIEKEFDKIEQVKTETEALLISIQDERQLVQSQKGKEYPSVEEETNKTSEREAEAETKYLKLAEDITDEVFFFF